MPLKLLPAALMFLTLLAHLFGGGPEIHDPLYLSAGSDTLKAFTSIIWHMVSITILTFFFALVWIAYRPNSQVAILLSLTQLGFAALFIIYGLIHLGNIWELPQWSVFLIIPALTMWGIRKPSPA